MEKKKVFSEAAELFEVENKRLEQGVCLAVKSFF